MTDNDRDIACSNAGEALNAYCNQRGMIQDPDADIAALIVDLLHLADQLDARPGTGHGWALIDRAMLHYDEERD